MSAHNDGGRLETVEELRDVLLMGGFVPCDSAVCGCGSWHHRYGYPDRMREIQEMLDDAGHPLTNANGNLLRNAVAALIAERDVLLKKLERLLDAAGDVADEHTGVVARTIYAHDDDEVGERVCCGVVSYKDHANDCPAVRLRDEIAALTGESAPGVPFEVIATFRCEENGIVGTTRAKVHGVTRHDDGVVEVLIDHWPDQPTPAAGESA